jgi:hypothetical protein
LVLLSWEKISGEQCVSVESHQAKVSDSAFVVCHIGGPLEEEIAALEHLSTGCLDLPTWLLDESTRNFA